jgi:hypothetical protein
MGLLSTRFVSSTTSAYCTCRDWALATARVSNCQPTSKSKLLHSCCLFVPVVTLFWLCLVCVKISVGTIPAIFSSPRYRIQRIRSHDQLSIRLILPSQGQGKRYQLFLLVLVRTHLICHWCHGCAIQAANVAKWSSWGFPAYHYRWSP